MKKTTVYILTLGRDVLVATCGGCIGIDALRADGKGWIDHGYITHWMPLPQPPREVERWQK